MSIATSIAEQFNYAYEDKPLAVSIMLKNYSASQWDLSLVEVTAAFDDSCVIIKGLGGDQMIPYRAVLPIENIVEFVIYEPQSVKE